MALDETLREVWPRVRKKHLFPELPYPLCAEGEKRVGLDIKEKAISISREFVEGMCQELVEGEVVEGLLDHAVSHYLCCPWNLSTHLRLYGEAKKVLRDKEMAKKATDYFMDVVADTHCVSQKETPLPRIYRHLRRGVLDEAVHALYERIWGVDLGVEGHEEISRKLSRLPYLDRSRWGDSMKRFAKAIHPLLQEERDQGGLKRPGPMGGHRMRQYSKEEIERGFKDLASDSATPSEFKEIVRDFEDDILEANLSEDGSMGLGPGRSLDADLLYYMKLAENWMLPIRKMPTKKSGSLYPHHHEPWEVGKPYQDIDPWTSFGKIMPGITQMWRRLEGDIFGQWEGIPDCVVMIDSSGSMTDPRQSLSYAVLGAACACDAYLRNGAQVAVYNFSDAWSGGRQMLPYSRQRREIYRNLCHYFGGGTSLMVEEIETLHEGKVPDLFLITDMQITNLETLIQYFNQCKNRITAVHIGDNRHVATFRQSMALRKNVEAYAVEKKDDIPRIVLGKVRDYLYRETL
ncbi:MAG: hypothetical protein KKE57_02215 [Proteobacteria bacterium]|nr:hypothetical protein [Pseudomonadota bacterium]